MVGQAWAGIWLIVDGSRKPKFPNKMNILKVVVTMVLKPKLSSIGIGLDVRGRGLN